MVKKIKKEPPKKMSTIKKVAGKAVVLKTQPMSKMQDSEYVYFIHEREFLNAKKPVYKLGKTTQWNCRRLQDYPKESALILVWRVPDCHVVERALIAEFDKRYKKRADIGAEYYEGNVNKMKTTFMNIVKLYPEDALNPGWFSWAFGGIWWGMKWVVRKT
jgi:T5orf172 domain